MTAARHILDFLRPGRRHRYGPHRSQCAEMHLPAGSGPHPVVVTIHGGSWQRRYGRAVMRALAADLVRRGYAVWNIEYRRLGEGGGWPATFADVAAAVDHLATLPAPVDLDRASVIGHSAGGQLALWAAGRERLAAATPGAAPAVRFTRAVGLAAVCDLAGAYRLWHGGAVRALMGGSPQERPERYAVADPLAQVPLAMPVLLVHGTGDETVSIELARRYARRARDAGGAVELVEVEGPAGEHRAHVYPRGPGWDAVLACLRRPVVLGAGAQEP